MKNLLLASTALVAFAGAAAAEVAISGSGRMGVVYDGASEEAEFSSRVRVAFTLTQETDSGVTFGASVRADNAAGGNEGTAGSVFMSGAFGKLSMGDVDGAAESAVGNLSGVGYTGLGDLNEQFYLQQGNSDLDGNENFTAFPLPAALYEYSAGGFTGYVGLGNPAGALIEDPAAFYDYNDDLLGSVDVTAIAVDKTVGLGAKYAMDNWSVGIGYERLDFYASTLTTPIGYDPDFVLDNDTGEIVDLNAGDKTAGTFKSDVDHIIVGGSVTFSGFTLKANYGEASGELLDLTQYGISGDYTFDAFTVTAFWNHKELKDKFDDVSVKQEPFGLGVTYDLGGGASVAAGIVDPDIEGTDYNADIGVNFSF